MIRFLRKSAFRWYAFSVLVCLLCAIVFSPLSMQLFRVPLAFASNTTYYINNQTSSCDNSGPHTQAQPWCDFTTANSTTFGPGDQILLASGATWDQQLTINGSGSSAAPATISAYGTGNRPRILRDGNPSDRGLRLNDPSYWNITNLEVGNAGAGILVYFTTLGHQGLHFQNIFVHDNNGFGNQSQGFDLQCGQTDRMLMSAGIDFTGNLPSFSSSDYVLQNVSMLDVEGSHNIDSISFDFCNGIASSQISSSGWQFLGPITSDNQDGHTLVRNVVLQRLNLHDDDGGNHPVQCPDSLRLDDVMNVTVLDSTLDHEAACHTGSGTAAVFLQRSQNVVFVNDLERAVPYTVSADQTGFDNEFSNDQASWRNNYLANNSGAGIEFLGIHGSGDHSSNVDVSGNLFVSNGQADNTPYGSIGRAGTDIQPTGTIANNLYSEPRGFLTNSGSANFNGFTQTNNLDASLYPTVFNSGDGFSSTQGLNSWSYQYSTNNGQTWNNLTYNATTQHWTPTGASYPYIWRFEQHPDSCSGCLIARVWTAPVSGKVSLRARVLKGDTGGGDGIGAQINLNGTTIWGRQTIAYNDLTGVATALDNLSVNAGDTLRFISDNGGNGNTLYDTTSWDPSLAYTSLNTAVSGPSIANAGFETPAVGSGFQVNPSNASWSFMANPGSGNSGVAGNGSAFTSGNPDAPEGSQVALMQQTCTFAQSIANFQANVSYTIAFEAAQRGNNGTSTETIQVFLDGTLIGSFTPGSTAYTTFTTNPFSVSAGTHTLQFVGGNSSGADMTAFLDHVRINTEA